MGKRPEITQSMSLAFAKVWGLFPCIDCDRLWQDGKCEDGVRPLYTWDQIEKDHAHELADEGPHTLENLFPRCTVEPYKHHQRKSARNETLRHHLDRAGEKHRGEFVNRGHRPMPKKKDHVWAKRKIESRGWQR